MNKLVPIDFKDNRLILLDQRKLPAKVEYVNIETVEEVFDSIRDMMVRGAPAIGITAAYGLYIAALLSNSSSYQELYKEIFEKGEYLKKSRPTAVNLEWAVDRIVNKVKAMKGSEVNGIKNAILEEATSIKLEDATSNKQIGEYLLELFGGKRNILTHCNAGILATGQYGTATSAFYLGKERGIDFKVYADETRPRLQGSTLTAFELSTYGIDVTVITDSTAAYLMSLGKIDAVVTGCDRVAGNGDAANKIGTLGLSISAKFYGIPMYIAAPTSSIDMNIESGKNIPIEERDESEVFNTFGLRTAPENVRALNYAFDITPNENITAIVTEKGIVYPPYDINLKKLLKL